MIVSFNHSSFTVSNLDRSIDFYTVILGMELISYAERPKKYSEIITGIKGCSLKIAYLKGYGHILELIEYVGSNKRNNRSQCDNIGSGHICFNVTDIQSIVDEFKKKGVQFKSSPMDIPSGANKGGSVVYAVDTDGIIVEFIELPLDSVI